MNSAFGFTLLEILISLFILSVMLLGLDAVQLLTLRDAKAAYYFSVATQQMNNMLERLQVTKNTAVAEDIYQWNLQNQKVLPQGRGYISGVYPHIKLTLYWGEGNENTCAQDKIGLSGCLRIDL